MIGKLTSFVSEPVRNVKLTITPDILESEISVPTGAVSACQVRGIIIERRRWLFRKIIRVWLETDAGNIDFYRSRSILDIALLLDHIDSEIGFRPRTLKNMKNAEQAMAHRPA